MTFGNSTLAFKQTAASIGFMSGFENELPLIVQYMRQVVSQNSLEQLTEATLACRQYFPLNIGRGVFPAYYFRIASTGPSPCEAVEFGANISKFVIVLSHR